MTSPNSHLGNVISRLSGLKSVSGRRVMDNPAQIGQGRDLEPIEAPQAPLQQPMQLPKFENLQPTQNVPQEDMGGSITPQSLDVRANSGVPQQNDHQQEPGFWSNVGRALSDYVNGDKRQEMAQQHRGLVEKGQMQQEMPQPNPMEPSQTQAAGVFPPQMPAASSGILGAISDYFSPTKNAEMEKYVGNLSDYSRMKAQGKSDEEIQQIVKAKTNENIAKATEQPWQHAAYGSAFEVANSPALAAQFQDITGQPMTPEVAQEISNYEGAMQSVSDELQGIYDDYGQIANEIKERIATNKATDQDKYYIGLALMMPLLVGGLFGAEAGFGALAGGAQAISGILNKRPDDIRKDEEALMGIGKQKADIQSKMAETGANVAKFAKNAQKGREHLGNLHEAVWKDPKTGKEIRGTELLPGFVADSKYVSTTKGLEKMEKAATELAQVKDFTQTLTGLTDDVIDIVSQLKDKGIFTQAVNSIKAGVDASFLDKFADKVMYQGREVSAGPILQSLLGQLTNAYGSANELGQTDRAMLSHIKTVWQNPTHTFTSPKTAIDEMLSVRNQAHKGLVNSAKNHGFIPEFVIRDLEEGNQVFGRLNNKQQDERAEQLFKQAAQGETRYAQ